MLNFVAWIVAGGALGYLASRLLPGRSAPGAMLNVLAGVVGGFVSGLAIKTVLLAVDPEMARLSVWALLSALAGASLVLVAVNLPVRGRAT